jgi:hypothetical protein
MLAALRDFVEDQSLVLLTVARIGSSEPHLSHGRVDSSPTPLPSERKPSPTPAVAPGDGVAATRPSQAPTALGLPAPPFEPGAERRETRSARVGRRAPDELGATDLSASNVAPKRRPRGAAWVALAAAGIAVGLGGGVVALLHGQRDGVDVAGRPGATGPARDRVAAPDAGPAGSGNAADVATATAAMPPVVDSGHPAPPDATPPVVTISLRGVPPGAAILLDGAHVEGHELNGPRSSTVRTLRVELAGHRPWERRVAFAQSVTLDVLLERARPPRPGAGAPRPATTPSAGADAPPPRPVKGDTPASRFGADFE